MWEFRGIAITVVSIVMMLAHRLFCLLVGWRADALTSIGPRSGAAMMGTQSKVDAVSNESSAMDITQMDSATLQVGFRSSCPDL